MVDWKVGFGGCWLVVGSSGERVCRTAERYTSVLNQVRSEELCSWLGGRQRSVPEVR